MNLKRATTVHLLGNGPSVRHFESDLFHTEPQDGVRISCNLGHEHLNCAWTLMGQRILFFICEQQLPFKTPIVVESHCLPKVARYTRYPQHLKTLTFHSVIKTFENTPTPSSGHKAVWYAISLYKPATIHLWGIDFFWTLDNTSLTWDTVILEKSLGHWSWNSAWEKLWSINSKIQFVIHTPTPIENLPKNVVTERL